MTFSVPSKLVIATRESRLALWQAEHVRERLAQRGWESRLLGMTTRGDQILARALSQVGGKGLFVKELEAALDQGVAHLAVHSLKDVPMQLPEGFLLAAVLEREDPRDAWVSNHYSSWQELPATGRVGTSSLRRMVQLLALRPDLQIEPLRGNLDTRLRKLDEGQFDGIVLAAAGLKRLGLSSRIRSLFDTSQMLPCAGQGALGIEIRNDAPGLLETLAPMTDPATHCAVWAERAVARALGGSCVMPLAAFAQWNEQVLELRAVLGAVVVEEANNGISAKPLLHASASALITCQGAEALAASEQLGHQVAHELMLKGAADYLVAAGPTVGESLV